MSQPEKYSKTTRYLHLIGGLAFIAALLAGLIMEEMEKGPAMFQVMFFHKSFGLAVLGFFAFRLIERLRTPAPAPLETHLNWEKALSKAIKIGLYVVMFALPVSGILMSWSGGHSLDFFGLFEIQPMIAKNETLNDVAGEIHDFAANLTFIMLGLHIVGTIKHKVIDRDATLERISPVG